MDLLEGRYHHGRCVALMLVPLIFAIACGDDAADQRQEPQPELPDINLVDEEPDMAPDDSPDDDSTDAPDDQGVAEGDALIYRHGYTEILSASISIPGVPGGSVEGSGAVQATFMSVDPEIFSRWRQQQVDLLSEDQRNELGSLATSDTTNASFLVKLLEIKKEALQQDAQLRGDFLEALHRLSRAEKLITLRGEIGYRYTGVQPIQLMFFAYIVRVNFSELSIAVLDVQNPLAASPRGSTAGLTTFSTVLSVE